MILRLDLTDLEAWQIYNSVRLHFTNQSYDFSKYGLNKGRFTLEAFQKRHDKGFYYAASKLFQYKGRWLPHCAINCFLKPAAYIDSLLEPEAKDRGLKFRGYLSGFWNCLENDLQIIYPYDKYTDLKQPFSGISSPILEMVRGEKVHPVTAVILDRYSTMLHNVSWFEDSVVQSDLLHRLRKFATFVPRLDDQSMALARDVIEKVWNDRKRNT